MTDSCPVWVNVVEIVWMSGVSRQRRTAAGASESNIFRVRRASNMAPPVGAEFCDFRSFARRGFVDVGSRLGPCSPGEVTQRDFLQAALDPEALRKFNPFLPLGLASKHIEAKVKV